MYSETPSTLMSSDWFPPEWRIYKLPDFFPGLTPASKLGGLALRCTQDVSGAYLPYDTQAEDMYKRSPEESELADIKYFIFFELHTAIHKRLTEQGSKRGYGPIVKEAQAAAEAANERVSYKYDLTRNLIEDFIKDLASDYRLERNDIFSDITDHAEVTLVN